jgi:carboxyl-terminal processing protease
MRFKRSILAPVAVLGIAVATGGWFLQQGVDQDQNVYFQARLFQEVVDKIASDYVDEVEKSSLYTSAIDGLIKELGDPNSSFLEAADYENLRIRTQGAYGGVGLEIIELDGFVTVVAPIPGPPSARAGLRAGDQFVEIAGQTAEGWDSDQAVELLRGDPGTDVEVKVRRIGVDQPISFTLTREEIHLKSVPFAVELRDGIAYVPLQVVRETSSDELRSALDSLGGEELDGIVLDLRGNPGGLLEQGIAVSDLFLPDGSAIVETRGRGPRQTETFEATRDDRYQGVPVAVLVDENSASASEIIAGALQDHDRAVVIGMPSFGKGSVQTLFRMSGGNVLRLTTARWFTPVGRSIDKPHDEREAEKDTLPLTVRLDGMPTSPPVLTDRPVVRSRGGRALFGGGGITPDLVIMADTLTEEEELAVRTIDRVAGQFERAMFDFAVRYVQERPGLAMDFVITDQDLDRLYDNLSEEVRQNFSRDVLRAASRYVRFGLERQIALQKWGEAAQFQRRVPRDLQLQAALDLLERADSPEALLQLVATPAPEAPAAAAAGRAGGR